MGEYIKNMVSGEEIKIGVLDCCFFSRKQIKEWLDDPDWVGWYAGKEEEGTLARYYDDPKTFYKEIEGLIHKEFAIKVVLSEPADLDHEKVHLWNKGKRGNGYQYIVDCQLNGKTEIWATIVGERYDKSGEGRTIFACDCCGALLSLPQNIIDSTLVGLDKSQRDYLVPILKARKEDN